MIIIALAYLWLPGNKCKGKRGMKEQISAKEYLLANAFILIFWVVDNHCRGECWQTLLTLWTDQLAKTKASFLGFH